MGTYRTVYERSLEQPAAFWAEAATALHWDRPWDTVLDADKAPFYRWFKGGRLNTCYNAVDRHVDAGRGEQAAIIHDSPVTGTTRTITYAELQDLVARFAGALRRQWRRQGRPGHRLHADGARGGGRHARLRPHRRRPFGGVRRLRRATSWRPASTTPSQGRSSPPPAASRAARSSPTSRCSTAAIDDGQAQAPALRHPAATAGSAELPLGRDLDWARRHRPRPSRSTACRSRPPTRSTSSTPRARPASPRAWFATTAATPWRCSGPCATSTASSPARSTGPPPTSAGSSATATSSTPRC